VADVSGHGASAAMLTGVVKSAFRSATSDAYEPRSVVERVADGVRAFRPHHFISLICVRVQNWTLDYVNAGHPPGILSSVTAPPAFLEATGPIISPALPCSWEQRTMDVNRGSDRLVLFTDAIIEAESDSGEYGIDRLVEEVGKRPVEGNALSEQVLESVREFAVGRPIKDDLTLVIADL
jgi:sigma-B regulation protein RsbU (phosphoserine phosphatase)